MSDSIDYCATCETRVMCHMERQCCATPQGRFTLVYSKSAAKFREANRARLADGREVEYTFMIEEGVSGPWCEQCKREDAVVVGSIDSYDAVTYMSPLPWPARCQPITK